MKKVLRKTVSIALIACMLLVAVPMMASASGTVNPTAALTVNGSTVTIAGNAGAADEMIAITVVLCDHNPVLTNGLGVCDQCLLTDPAITTKIKFMDDTLTAANGTYSFAVTALPDGTYTAFIGGTNVPIANQKKITFSKFPVVTTIRYGDLDRNGNLESADLALLLRYSVGVKSFDNDQLLAADLNGNESIESVDISFLSRNQAGTKPGNQFGKDNNAEFVPGGSIVKDETGNVIAHN